MRGRDGRAAIGKPGRVAMVEYVGFDVSKEATAFCVMDAAGKVLARGKAASDPGALFEVLRGPCLCPERIVLETGTPVVLAGARATPSFWPGPRARAFAAPLRSRARRRRKRGF